MIRKVFRTGNSIVVSLPRDALELLGVGEGSEVELEMDRDAHRVVITVPKPAVSQTIDEGFARQVSDFIERYRPALEALAR